MARRVDEVQAVLLAVARGVMETDALGFDGDAALALQIHRVEHLRGHFALGERAGKLEQAIGKGRLAMVDVRNDAEVADETGIHVDALSLRGAVAPRNQGAMRTLSLPQLGASSQTARAIGCRRFEQNQLFWGNRGASESFPLNPGQYILSLAPAYQG